MPGRVHFWWYIGVLFCFAATGLNVFLAISNPENVQYAVQSFICVGSAAVMLICKPGG